MRNNKGQALIEFILVLPVLLLIIISIIDFGNIILKKYSLENDVDAVATLYKERKDVSSYLNKNGLTIKYTNDENYTNITIYKNVKIISPVLVPILGSNYEIQAEKSVINE